MTKTISYRLCHAIGLDTKYSNLLNFSEVKEETLFIFLSFDTQLQLNCIRFRQERGKYWQRYDGIGLRC